MSEGFLQIGKLPGELLARMLAGLRIDDPDVVIGPGVGRDAAVVRIGDDLLVAKTDPITFVTDHAPDYLVNVNANDIACLGAIPRWMLVTALFPAGVTTAADVAQTFAGLETACEKRGIALIGGHTEITAGLDRTILIGQLLGLATEASLIVPGKAKPGDRLLLTRPIAVEGTAVLAHELGSRLEPLVGVEMVARARDLLKRPGISVVADAQLLGASGAVSALHDPTEGGLATGVREIATASGCGAVISRVAVPVLPETSAIAGALGLDPLGMLASGSLLAAIRADALEIAERVCRDAGMPFAWIGKLTAPEAGFTLRRGTESAELPAFNTDEVGRALALERMGSNR